MTKADGSEGVRARFRYYTIESRPLGLGYSRWVRDRRFGRTWIGVLVKSLRSGMGE